MGKKYVRGQLEPAIENTRPLWVMAFDKLAALSDPHWYPSLVVEGRRNRQWTVNSKTETINERWSSGVVVRVFDGVTLFEQATHDLTESGVLQAVSLLVDRVRTQSQSDIKKQKGKTQKPYLPPTWEERLKRPLEAEILEQIPPSVKSQDWVHFGTPQELELWSTDKEVMDFSHASFVRLQKMGEQLPLSHVAKDPDFIQVQVRLEKLDFVFIDRQTRMSQSLLRNCIIGVALKNGERGHAVKGGLGGQECLVLSDTDISEIYEKLRKCLVAENIQPGRYQLLMGPSITGVFAHEAFGHSQEGDTWARGRSKARELFESQTKVGNEHATILNNPAIYRNGEEPFSAWGSYYFDEEGWLAEASCLVKEGILQAPMTHLASAVRLGLPRTANGKRENWTHGVYTRQTNTYFSAGDKTLAELMASVENGFLATVAYGGMEDPKGMGIQVGMAYVEEIKHGKLTGRIFKAPNGGAIQMTGYVPDYLSSIIGKSKIEAHAEEVDESEHPWNEVGGCGKYHKESVAAGCGGPYMLVDNVLLS